MTENEDTYWDPSYEDYDYGEESYYGFKSGKGKRSKGKGRGKKGGNSLSEKDTNPSSTKASPKAKERTLERRLKMERQMLQALSQLHKMPQIQMPPMVRLTLHLHMEIRQTPTAKTGGKNTMTVQLDIHGTQRTA